MFIPYKSVYIILWANYTFINKITYRKSLFIYLKKIIIVNKLFLRCLKWILKAVFFGNNTEFIFVPQEEQNIANNCKRLIQNSVILWNNLYIDKKLKDAKSQS